jgi:hypothetical protein
VPGGRALLLQCFVAVVEDHDRREIGNRREHRGPATEHDARAATGLSPRLGPGAVGLRRVQLDDLTAVAGDRVM